jgi:hypothetical protein
MDLWQLMAKEIIMSYHDDVTNKFISSPSNLTYGNLVHQKLSKSFFGSR